MQLYHASCPQWDKVSGPVPRFRLEAKNDDITTRVYRCERCQDTIHIDMDWEEGVTVGPSERID